MNCPNHGEYENSNNENSVDIDSSDRVYLILPRSRINTNGFIRGSDLFRIGPNIEPKIRCAEENLSEEAA